MAIYRSNPPTALLLIGPKPLLARPIRKVLSDVQHRYAKTFPEDSLKHFLAKGSLLPLGMASVSWAIGGGFGVGAVLGLVTLLPIGFFKHSTLSFSQSKAAKHVDIIRACERGDVAKLESLKDALGDGRWKCSIRRLKHAEKEHPIEREGYNELMSIDSWQAVSPLEAVEAGLSSGVHGIKKYQTLNWFVQQGLLNTREREALLYDVIQNAPFESLKEHLKLNPHPGQDFEVLHALTHRDFGKHLFGWEEQAKEVVAIAKLLYPTYLTPKALMDYQQGKIVKFETQNNAKIIQQTFEAWAEPYLLKATLKEVLPEVATQTNEKQVESGGMSVRQRRL